MNTAYKSYLAQKGDSRLCQVVEDAKRTAAEDAQLRLARIQNGAHPDYQDGHPKDREKGR